MKKLIKSKLAKKIPTLQEFLENSNGQRRVRIFDESTYNYFISCIKKARKMVNYQKPYYVQYHAGGVAKAYFKVQFYAVTAIFGVWVLGDTVHFVFGETKINMNGEPSAAYFGGEISYEKAFRENKLTIKELEIIPETRTHLVEI